MVKDSRFISVSILLDRDIFYIVFYIYITVSGNGIDHNYPIDYWSSLSYPFTLSSGTPWILLIISYKYSYRFRFVSRNIFLVYRCIILYLHRSVHTLFRRLAVIDENYIAFSLEKPFCFERFAQSKIILMNGYFLGIMIMLKRNL